MLRAQVHLQNRELNDAGASIRAAMLHSLQLWWALPVPGAAKQVRCGQESAWCCRLGVADLVEGLS